MPPLVKVALDLGPLLIFFGVNAKAGIMLATAAFMVAVILSLGTSYVLERRIAIMPLITGAIVLVFGGLTLYLDNDVFIKLKPTIVNSIFVVLLLTGLALNKMFIKLLFEEVVSLPDHAWRVLTIRWAAFFFALAVLNEIVWRNFSTDFWVGFKVWGIFPLTLFFSVLQVPYIMRHQTNVHDEHARAGDVPPEGEGRR